MRRELLKELAPSLQPAIWCWVEAFVDTCLAAPAATAVRAEAGHWAIFRNLCTKADCRGNLIQDACLAAMALQHNCTYVTTDGDYARFPGLRWRRPLE